MPPAEQMNLDFFSETFWSICLSDCGCPPIALSCSQFITNWIYIRRQGGAHDFINPFLEVLKEEFIGKSHRGDLGFSMRKDFVTIQLKGPPAFSIIKVLAGVVDEL